MSIHSLAHDQCRSCGVVLGPLHLPHQLEVGRDGGTAMTRPLQVVEHHHIEGVGMVLRGEKVETAVVALNVSATCTRTINVRTVPYLCVCL